ncbi:MAG: hypothetical protein JZU65_14780 [Chlorobium sp.]|nr:hypothetical protein [Chlorobium sp.]
MLEGLSLTVIMSVVSMLGLPGLVLIFWYVDQRRYDRDRKEQIERDSKRELQHLAESAVIKEQHAASMALFDKRFEAVVRMYEDNVLLVKGYERLAGELTNVILLNTQIMTKLAERIDNNLFCPIVKKGGVHHGI